MRSLQRRILPLVILFLLFLPRRPHLSLPLLLLRFVRMGFVGLRLLGPFTRNVPLASILESATWSSPSVFSSFYLSNVQFSSSSGYGLGPLVAAAVAAPGNFHWGGLRGGWGKMWRGFTKCHQSEVLMVNRYV